MKTIFSNVKISGMLAVLPETVLKFEDEVDNYTFPVKQTLRLQKVMGFKQHRVVKDCSTPSDLALAGIKYLIDNNLIRKEEIGAVVVACAYPDHFIPPISSILHGKFGLSEDVFCVDISQGCCGFLMALTEGMFLQERIKEKKTVVIATDTQSKLVSKKDRNSWPMAGDAAGIAVLEYDSASSSKVYTIVRNNGEMGDALVVPAGGSRMPSTDETGLLADRDGDGNLRSLNHIKMKGTDVFNFVQTKVPTLVDDVLKYANVTKDDISTFLFHQPNEFMLRKLAEKIGIPYDKVPMNVVTEFGNSAGACIPVCATYNKADQLMGEKQKYCLSAFGSGLTWVAMVLEMGEMNFCEMLISDC